MTEFFIETKIWRYLTNFWTLIIFIFLIVDFVTTNQYSFLIGPLAAIYIAILGFFVSTKEFNRWQDYHTGRHPGEVFIIFWTVLILTIFLLNIFVNQGYHLSSEIIATYIAVLGIFAISLKSKSLYSRKRRK